MKRPHLHSFLKTLNLRNPLLRHKHVECTFDSLKLMHDSSLSSAVMDLKSVLS